MLVNKKNEKSIDDLISSIVLFERNSDKAYSRKISGEASAVVKSSSSQSSQSRTNMSKKNSGKCHYCHKEGHWLKRCFKWIKDGWPLRNDSKDSSNFHSSKLAEAPIATRNLALILVSCLTPVFTVDDQSDIDWSIDDGATRHVSKCLHWFRDYKPLPAHCSVQGAGGELKAVGVGYRQVELYVKGELKRFTLKDVWYVPNILKNLFSVLAAHDRNPTVRQVHRAQISSLLLIMRFN